MNLFFFLVLNLNPGAPTTPMIFRELLIEINIISDGSQ